jgi:hypothetical protein
MINPKRQNELLSAHVTEWFHRTRSDDSCPEHTVRRVCNQFLRYLRSQQFQLSIDEALFRRHICEAICAMYVAYKQGNSWRGPNSKMIRPAGWSPALETEWQEFLHYYYFSTSMWYDFWHDVSRTNGDEAEMEMWEVQVPNWKIHMQMILPHYIQCNPQKMFGTPPHSTSSDE